MSLRFYLAFLALLASERVAELVLSARHARRLLSRGAVEAGRGHYPAMVAFHALFLLACVAGAFAHPGVPAPWALLALAGALAAQVVRWWVIGTLGERWSTRVIVPCDEPPVTAGPYRFVRHPNYLAVALEMACVPLAYGLWQVALAFSLGNAALLMVRIRAEERALGAQWARVFRDRPRFLPGGRS